MNTKVKEHKQILIDQAREILAENKFEWNEYANNAGIHLQILVGDNVKIDFWPTTGKFWYEAKRIKGSGGVYALMEMIDQHFERIG